MKNRRVFVTRFDCLAFFFFLIGFWLVSFSTDAQAQGEIENSGSLKVEIMLDSEWDWKNKTETYRAVGDPITFMIKITNDGNVAIKHVRVYDNTLGISARVGELKPGETRTLNAGWDIKSYRIRGSDPDPFYILATAVGRLSGEKAGNWMMRSAVCEVDIVHPELQVQIEAPAEAEVGDLISFSITVKNSGDITLYRCHLIQHPYSSESSIVIDLIEELGPLAPGEERYFPFHYLVSGPDMERSPLQIRVKAFAKSERDGYPIDDWEGLIFDFVEAAALQEIQVKGVFPVDDVDITVSPFPDCLEFFSPDGAALTLPVVICNEGVDALLIDSVQLVGVDAAEAVSHFSIENPDYCEQIAGGTCCSVDVTFRRGSPGVSYASLLIASNDPDEPQMAVCLSGKAGWRRPNISQRKNYRMELYHTKAAHAASLSR